ncbi:MAG: hypothetical protein IKL41_04900 [Clostridia bacterium]|nr:hypothetical protein [Clostridia bacterium]
MNENVKVLGIITSIKKKITRSNAEMAFVTLEDMSGNIEALLFPKTVSSTMQFLQTGNVVLLEGRLSLREDKEPSLVCEKISPCPKDAPEAKVEKKVKHGLFLRVDSVNGEQKRRALNLLEIFEGNTPARFYYNDSKKYDSCVIGVDVNEPLLGELRRILGAENVVLQ